METSTYTIKANKYEVTFKDIQRVILQKVFNNQKLNSKIQIEFCLISTQVSIKMNREVDDNKNINSKIEAAS